MVLVYFLLLVKLIFILDRFWRWVAEENGRDEGSGGGGVQKNHKSTP